jgi:uncharacterized membrane protein YhhN
MAGVLLRVRPAVATVVRCVPAVLLAAGAGALVGLLPKVPATIDVILGSAVFFAVLALMGRFPPEIRDALRRAPRRARFADG